MTSDLDVTDPTFVQDLEDSREAVHRVARWLSGLGFSVVVPPTRVRPDSSVRSQYSDSGDLLIQQVVEVKRRGVAFTGVEDFPYRTVIVDVAHSFDRAHPKPYLYVICNQDMSGALIVKPGETSSRWTRVEKHDRHCGRRREFYECPVELSRYAEIPRDL